MASVVVAVGSLMGFHFIIVTQRERQEASYKESIESLREEVKALRARLGEAERARFEGPPEPQRR